MTTVTGFCGWKTEAFRHAPTSTNPLEAAERSARRSSSIVVVINAVWGGPCRRVHIMRFEWFFRYILVHIYIDDMMCCSLGYSIFCQRVFLHIINTHNARFPHTQTHAEYQTRFTYYTIPSYTKPAEASTLAKRARFMSYGGIRRA